MAYFLQANETPEATALESILAKYFPADGPGTAVLVARDGKILFSHGYGLADREKQMPATPETRFRIGSVTKQFTAAAILQLAGENKLSIEDPLSKYFPQYPGGDKITLHNLLNHTSGLHNYTAHPDFLARVIRPISDADLVAWFQDDPPDFAPGEQFSYCNTGYVLLGQIVGKVSGMSLGDYLQKQFFGPLGMHDTGVYLNATPPDHAARGYSFANNQLQPALDWDMSWAGGAGELYSTVGDLWRWTEALQGGRVLPPEGLQEMTTVVTVPKKDTLILRYGMGLYHTDIGGLPAVGHNGGLNGFLSCVMWFPEQKVTVAVLGNAMPASPGKSPEEILPIAARAFLGPEMAAHAPKIDPTIDPKIYSDYVGRYDYKSGIQEITTENGHLYAQLTGQNKFELFPSGPDAFFFKVVDAGMVFNRDKNGLVTSITHNQNGFTFVAPKLSDKDVITLPDATLDAIVGQYQYGPQVVLTVTRRGNQLFAQLTGQSEFPIFPKSDHEFYWKVVPASVEFVRGADGKVTGAIHHQNGITFSAPKLNPN
ncbi:MAG: serine hydrolase [Methylacidiphilales bacterium]|nr:serine hydrolase [Candidatus Methylacidiphilales bacterium]